MSFETMQPVQSPGMLTPQLITAAAEISPITRFVHISGTTPITTINPPIPSAYQELILRFETGHANSLVAGGNISAGGGYTSITNRPITVYYDPATALWYIQTVA